MTHYVLYIGMRSLKYNYNMYWGLGLSLLRNTLSGWLNFVALRKRFLKAWLLYNGGQQEKSLKI